MVERPTYYRDGEENGSRRDEHGCQKNIAMVAHDHKKADLLEWPNSIARCSPDIFYLPRRQPKNRVFHQLLTPVFNALLPSLVVAISPILTVLALLGALRRPAWEASLAGLLVGFIVAVGPWRFPASYSRSMPSPTALRSRCGP